MIMIYMWNLKNDSNKLIYKTNRLRDIENKLLTKVKRSRRGIS